MLLEVGPDDVDDDDADDDTSSSDGATHEGKQPPISLYRLRCDSEEQGCSRLHISFRLALPTAIPAPPPPPPPPSSRSDKPKQPMISSTHAAFGASKSSDHDHLVLERIFRCFDENGDGKISPGELQRCMRAVGEELSCEEAEAAVRSADWDGDGLIGFEDFVKLVESEGEEEKGRSLRGAFGVYEMEGRGASRRAASGRRWDGLGRHGP
uniref:EF-hand domain-containing protein n=1 Tax=Ananas comosus var. bracteatus TaxID=296719 RepID=A0A6V7QRC5_ANACO